jgi:cytochrome b561/polyisoprenoid-binding protein YceI
MARANTHNSYGSVTKSFHWLTALLILSVFPLGLMANDLAYQIKNPAITTTNADIALTATLFSIHKTIGVAIFFVALARILWAISQPKPGLINGNHRMEALAATTVHWLLYSSLVIVPLSGWIHHAATTGFAPIWWPFGQSLPFIPKDPVLADQTSLIHHLSIYVLGGSLLLHIAGALKHHVIDRDATLRRMLPGVSSAEPSSRQPGEVLPFGAALAVWVGVLVVGGALSLSQAEVSPQTAELETVDSQWQVTDGTLQISVTQFGSTVAGGFSDWTAAIDYKEIPNADGKHGTVNVLINIGSLSLGSVTDQAKGSDYFDLANHPTATFEADILSVDGGQVAIGTLTIKDQSVPIELPFDLSVEDDTANAAGTLSLDRRDFLIGMGTTDESTLGFEVAVSFELTAKRGEIEEATATAETDVSSNGWRVDDGMLGLAIRQMGSEVTGSFANWTAEIDYIETADDAGRHGSVAVQVDIASLTLGSVSDQAKGADYFDAASFPTALFEADILTTGEGHIAKGLLTIKDQSLAVEMPFDLEIDGETAVAAGTLTVDRRDFSIGLGTTDEGSLAFPVDIKFSLTATRSADPDDRN